MFDKLLEQIKTSLLLLLSMSVITGLFYPGLVTIVAQTFFPWRANGSLLQYKDKIIGSYVIGQYFNNRPEYFWGRPSATADFPYNALASGGSNLGPLNPILLSQVQMRMAQLSPPAAGQTIPMDLVTTSGSGLDPDISPIAALYQAERIAEIRHIPIEFIVNVIDKLTYNRTLGVLGEPRINVLELNLALDQLGRSYATTTQS